MANSFKPEDKVVTKHKGAEVEATVRIVWNDEVQVRTPDGVLRWRTVKTVWLASTTATASETSAQLPPEGPAATPTSGAETLAHEQPGEAPPQPNADEHATPAPTADAQPATQEVQDHTQEAAAVQPKADVVPCGATDAQPKAKRDRKARHRR